MGLVELGVAAVEAVMEVVEQGATVTARYGVTRQTLHNWNGRDRQDGMSALVDRS